MKYDQSKIDIQMLQMLYERYSLRNFTPFEPLCHVIVV